MHKPSFQSLKTFKINGLVTCNRGLWPGRPVLATTWQGWSRCPWDEKWRLQTDAVCWPHDSTVCL